VSETKQRFPILNEVHKTPDFALVSKFTQLNNTSPFYNFDFSFIALIRPT